MYGLASESKFQAVEEYGALPLDYKKTNWMEIIKHKEPKGLDFVFDGLGKSYIDIGFQLLKKGGKLIEYGYPNFLGMLSALIKAKWLTLLPNGKSVDFYGISANYKKDKSSILEDLTKLFVLLKEDKIHPKISHRLPILEAAKANKILENGAVTGKIVLLSPELLHYTNSTYELKNQKQLHTN